MKKRILSLILILAMAFTVAACGSGGNSQTVPSSKPAESAEKEPEAAQEKEAQAETSSLPGPDEKLVIRLSSSSGATDIHTDALYVFEEQLESLTKNIDVEVYHSSTLFAQDANVSAMLRGNLDMTLSGPSWLGVFLPYLNMFKATYLFRDYEHLAAVLDGEIGAEVFEDVAQQLGIRPLAAFFIGSRCINLVEDREIRSRADLKGVSLRVANADSWIQMCNALGADPVPMALNETYLGLQTGVVDGQENPLPITMNNGFGEVTKSITITNHVVDSTWLCIDENLWQSFDPELQAAFMTAATAAKDYCDSTYLSEMENYKQQFIDMGLTVYEPDLTKFEAEVSQYNLDDPTISGDWDMDLYQRIKAVK